MLSHLKTEGFSSLITFLNVLILEPSPAAFTPIKRNVLLMFLALFLFALLVLLFFDILYRTLLLKGSEVSDCFSKEVLDFLEPPEKPTLFLYHPQCLLD